MFGIYRPIKKIIDKYLGIGEFVIPPDIKKDTTFLRLYHKCEPYSMTQIERQYNIYQSILYLSKNMIPGSIVECGVYKGGSSMMAALSLSFTKDTGRKLYLYDTYQGMTKPTDKDVDIHEEKAIKTWKNMREGNFSSWTKASLGEVEANMKLTKYPKSNLKYIVGKVEDTIPKILPTKIALLRLDTDWYESTKHELKHLFPLVVPGGILIIDDYGHFTGAKKAVDEYFKSVNLKVYLNRVDYSSRLVIKQ